MLLVRENVGANQNTYTLKNIGRPAPESIDSPLKKGLDGIYENQTPPPSYVINESKWGTSQLNQTTADGPQMSKQWVRNRLDDLDIVDQLKIQRALKNNDVEFVVSRVDASGNVTTHFTKEIKDSAGNIKVVEGGIWP